MIFPEEIKNGTSSQDRKLREENRILEEKLSKMGAHFGGMEEKDPKIHNAFLKHILDCEESIKKPHNEIVIRTLFPKNFEFPDADTFNEEELEKKIEDILDILEKSRIYVDLVEKLPDKIFYEFIVDTVLNDKISPDDPSNTIYNGCGGDCESCFQRDYCDVALENDDLDGD
ncbi:MAG: hypothetical protein ACLFQB_15585 [Chitinispirillaceae bacterium]